MKQIMFGMFSGVFVLLCAIAILTVEGRTNRENELKHALSAAMEETMQNLCMTHKYEVESREEFAADFCQALLQKIQVGLEEDRDRHLSLQVNITEADPKKGLLSVAVTENFSHPKRKNRNHTMQFHRNFGTGGGKAGDCLDLLSGRQNLPTIRASGRR